MKNLNNEELNLSKVTGVAAIGSFVNYYDLFIAAVAASLVWTKIFFNGFSPVVAAAYSLVSVGILQFARPVGGLVFGHISDRHGRKTILIWTFILMAIGVLGIATLPTFNQIGYLAPALLLVYRMIQGIGLGGEYSTAITWVSEFAAKSSKRGFFTGMVQVGAPLGSAVSSLSWTAILAVLPLSSILSWGWRLLYFTGFATLIVGLFIRYYFSESPLFKEVREKKVVEKSPIAAAFKYQWKIVVLISLVASYLTFVASGIISPFSLNYMVAKGVVRTSATLALALGALGSILFFAAGSYLGDVIGRKKVILGGIVACAVLIVPYFLLLGTGVFVLLVVGQVLLYGFAQFANGSCPPFFTENYPTRYRNSGVASAISISDLITGIAITIVEPVIIVASGGTLGGVWIVAGFAIVLVVVSALAILPLKDTKSLDVTKDSSYIGEPGVDQ